MDMENFMDVLVDEIALEGLDGITLPSLWLRVEERGRKEGVGYSVGQEMMWTALTSHADLSFYQLPEPRPDIHIYDRYTQFHSVSRIYVHPENLEPEPYKFEAVEQGDIVGSCSTFHTRTDISADIRDEEGTCLCSYTEAMDRWGRSLVVVASQLLRNLALTGRTATPTYRSEQLQRYYFLEMLGRSRWNGLSTGSFLPQYSCQPLGMNAKLIFYMVKNFCKLKLTRKQVLRTRYDGKTVTMNLVHLSRFYRPLPNKVKEVKGQVCQHLDQQENKMQLVSVIKDMFNLQRSPLLMNVLDSLKDCVSMETVSYRTMYPDDPEKDFHVRNGEEKQLNVVVLKKKYREEEEGEEEEEEDVDDGSEPVCTKRLRVVCTEGENNVSVEGEEYMQAVYQVIHSHGAQGISLGDLMASLSLTYRMVRNATKCFQRNGDIKPILKSFGVLRIKLYVARPFLAASAESFGKALTEFRQKTTERAAESSSQEGLWMQHNSDKSNDDTANVDSSCTQPGDTSINADISLTQPGDTSINADISLTQPGDTSINADISLTQPGDTTSVNTSYTQPGDTTSVNTSYTQPGDTSSVNTSYTQPGDTTSVNTSYTQPGDTTSVNTSYTQPGDTTSVNTSYTQPGDTTARRSTVDMDSVRQEAQAPGMDTSVGKDSQEKDQEEKVEDMDVDVGMSADHSVLGYRNVEAMACGHAENDVEHIDADGDVEDRANSDVMDVSEDAVASRPMDSDVIRADGDGNRWARLQDITYTFVDNSSAFQHKHIAHPIKNECITERMLVLANILLDCLKKYRLLDSVASTKQAIVKGLRKLEEGGGASAVVTPPYKKKKKKGKKEVAEEYICQKTVVRLLDWCHTQGKLNKYNVCLKFNSRPVYVVLVCATDIQKDDPLVLNAIQRHKLKYFGSSQIKEVNKLNVPLYMLDWSHVAKCALQATAPFDPRRKMSKSKKWEKACMLHRFVWYVVYGYKGTEPSEHGTQHSERGLSHKADAVEELDVLDMKEGDCMTEGQGESCEEPSEPQIYLDTRDWRRYIPPIRHTDVGVDVGRTEGVCTIGDLLMVMPLSIFAPLSNMQELPIVQKYLRDNRKRHYPITSLPLEVLGSMLQMKLYMTPILDVFRSLCGLGLLAVGPQSITPDRSKQSVYLRKTGVILDTRESQAGNLFTVLPPHLEAFPEKSFHFDSMDDVLRYWTTLQTIALNTDLNNVGMTDTVNGPVQEIHPFKECMYYGRLDTVVDDFCLPGNRFGAAGTDTSLFIHLRRNWSAQQLSSTCIKLKKKSVRIAGKSRLSTTPICPGSSQARDDQPHDSSQGDVQSKKVVRPRVEARQLRRSLNKSKQTSPQSFYPMPVKYRTPRIGTRRHKDKTLDKAVRKKAVIHLFDDIDREAYRNRKGRRSKFSSAEISVIMMGKVALNYLAGEHSNVSFYMPIRDILRQRMPLQSADKTTRAVCGCIRRHMKRNNIRLSMTHYLMRLEHDKELVNKYSGVVFPKNKKELCTPDISAVIVSLINDLLEKFMVFETNRTSGVLPLSLRWMERCSDVMLAEEDRGYKLWTDVASFREIWNIVLRDFQLSHMLCTGDKQSRLYELHKTLVQYPTDFVNSVFTDLTNRGVITKNKKNTDGEVGFGMPRYMLNNKYQVRLRQARHPSHLFTSAMELLSHLQHTENAEQSSKQTEQSSKQTEQSSKQTEQSSKQTEESSKQTEQSSKQTEESSKQTEQSSKQTEQSSKQTEQSSKQTEQSSKQTEQSSKQTEQSSKQTEQSSKQTEQSSKQTEQSSKQTEQSSKQTEQSSKQTEQSSKQTEESSKQTEQSSKQTEQSSKQTEESSKQTEQSSKQTEQSSKQTEQSSKQTEQSSKQTEQSSKQTEQSSKQTEESSKQTEQSSKQTEQSSKQTEQSSKQTEQSSKQTEQSSKQTEQSSKQTEQSTEETGERGEERGGERGEEAGGRRCAGRSRTGHGLYQLPQGMAVSGHVALVIALTAVNKVHMTVETNEEVIDVSSSKETFLKDTEVSKGQKRSRRELSDHRSPPDDDGKCGDDDTARGDGLMATPPAKRLRLDKDDGGQTLAHGPENKDHTVGQSLSSPILNKGGKRVLSSDSSSEDDGERTPCSKRRRVCEAGGGEERGGLFLPCMPFEEERFVREDPDGMLRLQRDGVSIRFCKKTRTKDVPTPVEAKILNSRASFTLLALRRMLPKCKLDPRKHSSSNRLSLSLSRIALALNDRAAETPTNKLRSDRRHVRDVASKSTQGAVCMPSGMSMQPQSVDVPNTRSQTNSSTETEVSSGGGTVLPEVPVWTRPSMSGSDHVIVEREVFQKIVRRQSQLLPFSVDWDEWWTCASQVLHGKRLSACQEIYRHIVFGGVMGLTWCQLKGAVTSPVDVLYDILQFLLEENVVIKVGVTMYRFVSLSNARHWLMDTLKNNRGRGSVATYTQEDMLTEASQGDMSHGTMPQQPAADSPTMADKTAQSAVDSLTMADKTAQSAVDSLTMADKTAQSAVDSLTMADKTAQSAVDSLTMADKTAQPAVDSLTMADKTAQPAVDSLTMADKTAQSAVDSLTMADKTAQPAVDSLLQTANSTDQASKEQSQNPVTLAGSTGKGDTHTSQDSTDHQPSGENDVPQDSTDHQPSGENDVPQDSTDHQPPGENDVPQDSTDHQPSGENDVPQDSTDHQPSGENDVPQDSTDHQPSGENDVPQDSTDHQPPGENDVPQDSTDHQPSGENDVPQDSTDHQPSGENDVGSSGGPGISGDTPGAGHSGGPGVGADGREGAMSMEGEDMQNGHVVDASSVDSAMSTPAKRTAGRKRCDRERSPSEETHVKPTSTYEKIRLRCRTWRRPEGGLNSKVLKDYLRSIMFYLKRHPASTLLTLCRHYELLFSPVDMRDLLQILEDLGCVTQTLVQSQSSPTLFSPRPSPQVLHGPDILGATMEELVVEPTVDCTHRLGQFFTFLH